MDTTEKPIQTPGRGAGAGEPPPPAGRFGILGLDVILRTDSDAVGSFFRHAYRWFPPAGGEPLEIEAWIARGIASAGGRSLDLSGSPSPENRAFLYLLESIMDRIGGCVLLHGAAVARGDEGILLAGPATAGKSTLTLEMLRLGYDFLSDDAAPIDGATGMLLPFPRAIGIRKPNPPAESRPPAVPPGACLELPHKWLVDPAALGAGLPATARRPSRLFYLDPPAAATGARARRFEICLAGADAPFRKALQAIDGAAVSDLSGRPFPALEVVFAASARPVGALADLVRRRRDVVLSVEEVRPPIERRGGDAVVRPSRLSPLLLPLVRDILNRGEEGALLGRLGGGLTSLVAEVARLMSEVRCHVVEAGTPAATAAAIDRTIKERS